MKRLAERSLGAVALLLAASLLAGAAPVQGPGPGREPRTASSRRGVVVAGSEEAARAGAELLEAGGNAVDAAVASALALAVTYPQAGNLAGGGFLVARTTKG